MNEDGKIDYSLYSRDELLQVLDDIDGERYPLNLQRLLDELGRRPVPPVLPTPPTLTKRERAAAALELDFCWITILGYTLTAMVLSLVFEVVARWTAISDEMRGPLSLLPVFCLCVLLARRSPRAFYINASVIVFNNIAFWTLLSLGSSQDADLLLSFSALFWSWCTVGLAGLLCGLWPIGSETRDA